MVILFKCFLCILEKSLKLMFCSFFEKTSRSPHIFHMVFLGAFRAPGVREKVLNLITVQSWPKKRRNPQPSTQVISSRSLDLARNVMTSPTDSVTS